MAIIYPNAFEFFKRLAQKIKKDIRTQNVQFSAKDGNAMQYIGTAQYHRQCKLHSSNFLLSGFVSANLCHPCIRALQIITMGRLYVISRYNLRSHCCPTKLSGHAHVYPPPLEFAQVPPFAHGDEAQPSTAN